MVDDLTHLGLRAEFDRLVVLVDAHGVAGRPVVDFAGAHRFLAPVGVVDVDRALHHHAPMRALAEIAGHAFEQRLGVGALGEADACHVHAAPILALNAHAVRLQARRQVGLGLLHLPFLSSVGCFVQPSMSSPKARRPV
jgi:hypothetical protein